ncbi:uncharacterized protein LOC128672446 isoform X2 [Plodia interpunctella]|uniref:uncharacterized protein LOC128672446 isoform X2 n=1 Tax=Plodia interpunctella TaxID=58824 RepID=UPI002368C79C|nr:uncharacterized protein LOC128672446 isoform X2 [Plodia interpunctella]
MIDLLFVAFLIIFLVYHYIWTGSCGMACRNSGYSRFSGMSGLNLPARLPVESGAPSSSCVCESCPCAFLENILRRCQPATDVCEQRMEVISVYVAGIMRVVNDVYVTFLNTMDSSPTQRQAQLVSDKQTYESNHNFTFDRDRNEHKPVIRQETKQNTSASRLPKITELAKKLTHSDTTIRKDIQNLQNKNKGTSTEAGTTKNVQTATSASSGSTSTPGTGEQGTPDVPSTSPNSALQSSSAAKLQPGSTTSVPTSTSTPLTSTPKSISTPTSSSAPTALTIATSPSRPPLPIASPSSTAKLMSAIKSASPGKLRHKSAPTVPTEATTSSTDAPQDDSSTADSLAVWSYNTSSCAKCAADGQVCGSNCPTRKKI